MTIYLGENLKKLRREKNITQEKLAEFLGITFQSISNWERGESYPDITMLPDIAAFFRITVDELLGKNQAETEKIASEYLTFYDNMRYKDTSLTFSKFQQAIKDFPSDFRILVRYMELLMCEKSAGDTPEYEKASQKLLAIYDNIQNYCTDDSIRMWSKRLICQHLHTKAHYTNNENYQNLCEQIMSEMPDLINTKDYLSTMLISDKNKHYDACSSAIETLLFLLEHSVDHYCLYDEDFPPEYKIEALEKMLKIYDIIFTDKNYGKLWLDVIYNHWHLGHFYYEAGQNDNALNHLKFCAKLAVKYDKLPQNTERTAQFFEGRIFAKVPQGKTMCNKIKYLLSEKYHFSEQFKTSEIFKEIVSLLNNNEKLN